MWSGCALALVWTGPIAPASGDSGPGGGGGGGGGETRDVQVRDDCDPATFNAALGPGACVGNGDVTFQEFEAELNPRDFGEDHWRFNPDHTEIRHNEALRPFNRGGETHTFTGVAAYGPGCVQALNDGLGLTGPPVVADCAAAIAATSLAPGQSRTLRNLTPGVHRYECLIHPWMRSTVVVR